MVPGVKSTAALPLKRRSSRKKRSSHSIHSVSVLKITDKTVSIDGSARSKLNQRRCRRRHECDGEKEERNGTVRKGSTEER